MSELTEALLVTFAIVGGATFLVQIALWIIKRQEAREDRLKNIEYELKFRTGVDGDFEHKARGEARLHPEATLTGFIHSFDIGRGSK